MSKDKYYNSENFLNAKEQYQDPSEDSKLVSFEEENYSEQQKFWLYNIRRIY